MLLKKFDVDPIEYVIENQEYLTKVLNGFHKKALKYLLSNHDLQVSGNKDTLVKNILDGIKFGTISLKEFQNWSYQYLEEGKRHLFISDIIQEQVNMIKNVQNFEDIIKENNFEKKNLLYKNVEDGLVLFNYTIKDNEIERIKLGFKEQKMLRIPNYESGVIEKTDISYYIFVDIYLPESMMTINLEPVTGLIETESSDESVSVKKIASKYQQHVAEIFGLVFHDAHEITQKALYRIWKDATKHELPELLDIIDGITDEVNSFVADISKEEKLNLESEIQSKLASKVLSNIENAILTAKYEEFKEKIEQTRNTKLGYITEHSIRERTGSLLRQKSPDKLTPIEESDAFGDTRVTIDQLERVQKLYYTWKGVEDIPPGTIPTIIESFRQYDLIIFSSHTTLEEIEHVLHRFKRYKDKIRPTRSSNLQTGTVVEI